MQNSWIGIALMALAVVIGLVVGVRLSPPGSQRRAVIGSLGGVTLVVILFFLVAIAFSQRWTAPLFAVACIVVPVAVYVGMTESADKMRRRKRADEEAKARAEEEAAEPEDKPLVKPVVVKKPTPRAVPKPVKPSRPSHAKPTPAKVALPFLDLTTTKAVPVEKVNMIDLRPIAEEQEELRKAAEEAAREAAALEEAGFEEVVVEDIPFTESPFVPADLEEPEPVAEPEPEPEPAWEVFTFEPEHAPAPEPAVAYVPEPEPAVAFEPPAEPEPVAAPEPEPSPYEGYCAKAQSLRERGIYAIAARLFGEAAATAPSAPAARHARFDELACYVKAGDGAKARALAAELRQSSVLTRIERVKLDAVERMG